MENNKTTCVDGRIAWTASVFFVWLKFEKKNYQRRRYEELREMLSSRLTEESFQYDQSTAPLERRPYNASINQGKIGGKTRFIMLY